MKAKGTPRGPYLDRTGKVYCRLTVIELVGRRGNQFLWKCLCECGNTKNVTGASLRRGDVKSCGCLQRESMFRSRKHGMSDTRTHTTWRGMKARCHNTRDVNYRRYGGRGITVCERWRHSFNNFLEDMGEAPAGLSLDRINNDGNYCPENCRWATVKEQGRNRSTNRRLTHNGRHLTIAEWSEITGVIQATIVRRLSAGWTVAEAIQTPAARPNMRIRK